MLHNLIPIKCPCGYLWNTRTTRMHATCPSCLRHVNVERNKVAEFAAPQQIAYQSGVIGSDSK